MLLVSLWFYEIAYLSAKIHVQIPIFGRNRSDVQAFEYSMFELMKLTSSHPFWPQNDAPQRQFPALENDAPCEIAVIGGGITGALVARELVNAGFDTLLLDKRELGGGSTSASTALLLYEIDVDLHELIPLIGETNAVRAYNLCRDAIAQVGEIAREVGENSFVQRESWYLASEENDVPRPENEYAARCQFGFETQLLRRRQIEEAMSFSRAAALVTHESAQVDVFGLAHKILNSLHVRGLRIYEKSAVIEYSKSSEKSGEGVNLRLENGVSVRARRVVFANGYEAQQLLKQPIVRLKSTYVVVSEPLQNFDGWPQQAQMWETARPYLYLRTTPDGRAMIGGEDDAFSNEVARDRQIKHKTAISEARFRELFPRIPFERATSYAGTFGETCDGLAYIGASPEFENGFFALGFGGNGITFSVVASQIIREMCRGNTPEDAQLFRFDR